MNNPHEYLNNREYFYARVSERLKGKIVSIERILLSLNIWDELFERALEIGYDKEQSKIINKRIVNRYRYPIHQLDQIDLSEDDYCKTALAQIIQERINNSEIFEENVILLDQMLVQHDPLFRDEYLKPAPSDVSAPEFESKPRVEGMCCELPESFASSEWITLYSSNVFRLKNFDKEEVEVSNIATSLIPEEKIVRYQGIFSLLTVDEIVHNLQFCQSIAAFKKPLPPSYGKLGLHTIIAKRNYWELQFPNLLVRLDQSFLDQNNLKWDKKSPLDLMQGGSKVVRYLSWASPFDGESHSQKRVAEGVRLQMRRGFLKRYLKSKNMSILMIHEKKHSLIRSSTQPNILNSRRHALYSDTHM